MTAPPSSRSLAGKLACDQLLMAPPFLALFLGVLYAMEAAEASGAGRVCAGAVCRRLRNEWPGIMLSNYVLWVCSMHCPHGLSPALCIYISA